MTTTVTELELSRRTVARQSHERLYLVTGTDDEQTALAAVLAVAPTTYAYSGGSGSGKTLVRQDPEIEPLAVESGDGFWQVRVTYGISSSKRRGFTPDTSLNVYSFDTTGGTTHITQSKATIGVAVPSGLAVPDFKGCIGWDGKNVNGCEIVTPVFRWEEKVWKAPADVDQAYRIACHNLTGKVNNGTFRGFPAGDVLFLGVRGSRTGDGDDDLWELTFSFAASPNGTNLTVGDITVPAKKGWEYLWVYYEDAESGMIRAKRPRAAVVEQVYDAGAFSTLEIGTS